MILLAAESEIRQALWPLSQELRGVPKKSSEPGFNSIFDNDDNVNSNDNSNYHSSSNNNDTNSDDNNTSNDTSSNASYNTYSNDNNDNTIIIS